MLCWDALAKHVQPVSDACVCSLTPSPAELYGPNNTALSRLTIDIYPPEASFPEGPAWGRNRSAHSRGDTLSVHSSGGPGVGGQESRRFALNWRIPGCVAVAAACCLLPCH